MNNFKHNKLRDEFIEKVTSAYCNCTLNTPLENKKIKFDSNTTHIKSLWSWIKGIARKDIKTNKSIDKDYKNVSVIKTVRNDKYRDFCKDLMFKLEISDFEEFRNLIVTLLNRYSKKSKMNKTKRLLSYSPQYYK